MAHFALPWICLGFVLVVSILSSTSGSSGSLLVSSHGSAFIWGFKLLALF